MPAAMAASGDTIVFGYQSWPGATIKTEIARQILGKIGYQTKGVAGTSSVLSVGMRQGDIDVMLENWMPDMKEIIKKNLDSGKVKQLAVNIKDARLDLVVPSYVWKAGVHSIADLDKHAGKFKHKIYGIEPGNVDNQIVKDAISKNTYDLGQWELVPSSTAAMMTEAGKHVKNKEWIVFIGWRPHWMNIKYDLKYLHDPKEIFGSVSRVLTLANTKFVKSHPNVARFLKQFVQSNAVESAWIYQYGYKKGNKKAVAHKWIRHHESTLAKWLEGVKTADGSKPAIHMFQ